jgi:uncharacterized membrane protein YtjA (UPF0391 family)
MALISDYMIFKLFSDNEVTTMFSWAVTFLIIAIVAAIFGFTGIAGTATQIAWILFVVGIVLFVIFTILGRRPRL